MLYEYFGISNTFQNDVFEYFCTLYIKFSFLNLLCIACFVML